MVRYSVEATKPSHILLTAQQSVQHYHVFLFSVYFICVGHHMAQPDIFVLILKLSFEPTFLLDHQLEAPLTLFGYSWPYSKTMQAISGYH